MSVRKRTVIHGGISSAHGIAIDDRDVEMNSWRESAHTISTTTVFISTHLPNTRVNLTYISSMYMPSKVLFPTTLLTALMPVTISFPPAIRSLITLGLPYHEPKQIIASSLSAFGEITRNLPLGLFRSASKPLR